MFDSLTNNIRPIASGTEDAEKLIDAELNRLFPERTIERVLLVMPPEVDAEKFDYEVGKRYRYWNCPPYGLGIIASHLRKDGIEVKIINLNNEVLKACRTTPSKELFDFDKIWKSVLSLEINSFRPDIVGITCLFTITHQSAAHICAEIKGLTPNTPLALGGVHITNCFMDKKESKEILNDFSVVDLFFLFEAELAFRNFVQKVNRTAQAELFQVYFNTSSSKLYIPDKKIPTEEEMNVIPAHDLMATEEMSDNGVIGGFHYLKDKGTRFTVMLSNRGCRGSCTYCSVRNFNGIGVRHRSIQSIIDEMLFLRDRFGIDHIMWLDDDLLHDHNRTLSLFNEMVRQNLGVTWDCTNGVVAASCTEEIIAAAAESGCIGLVLGVESGNAKMLKKVRKPSSIKNFIEAAEILKKYEKINSRAFLIIGLPDESYGMILDTFNLALRLDLDWYYINILQPLPNTPIFETMVQQGLVDTVNSEEMRFSGGPFGKKRKRVISSELVSPFANKNLNDIPLEAELEHIRFYMDFHINFKRLFKVNSPVKIKQQRRYVLNIKENSAPDDPIPMYFNAYLQKRITGQIEKEIISRLESCLDSSEYWTKLFAYLNLSVEHLKSGIFPTETIASR